MLAALCAGRSEGEVQVIQLAWQGGLAIGQVHRRMQLQAQAQGWYYETPPLAIPSSAYEVRSAPEAFSGGYMSAWDE